MIFASYVVLIVFLMGQRVWRRRITRRFLLGVLIGVCRGTRDRVGLHGTHSGLSSRAHL